MIKFFRNIRKALVTQNKLSKYVLYAIGEIILVVIGILIALQINNWNEIQKLRIEEISLLTDVKSNLATTLDKFKRDSLKNLNHIRQYERIKRYINEDLPYSTELDTAFGRLKSWSSPYPIYTAYTTLKTKGLDIILNADLRSKIVDLYEYKFTRLTTDYDKAEWILYDRIVLPFISENIRIYRKKGIVTAKPNDFGELKQNEEFSNILELLINERKSGLVMYSDIMTAITDLMQLIEDEISLRK